MDKIEKQILEEYLKNYSIAALSYEIMGLMLDDLYVEERFREFDISDP